MYGGFQGTIWAPMIDVTVSRTATRCISSLNIDESIFGRIAVLFRPPIFTGAALAKLYSTFCNENKYTLRNRITFSYKIMFNILK